MTSTKHIRVAAGQQGQPVLASKPIVPPHLGPPLIHEPAQANPPANTMVGPLDYLIGTWTNQNLGTSSSGGPESPFSYNLMVLPQAPNADPNDPKESPYGYILKSMSYYEEITFSPIHGTAANRGGTGSQISNALLYEQRVYISDGPAKDTLVHFENGIWGFLTPAAQALGPYGDGDGPDVGNETFGEAPPPLPDNIFKQISVPHGNSVLACGNVPLGANMQPVPQQGAPNIGPPPQVLPSGINTDIYGEDTVQSLNSVYALNPNQPLIDALAVSGAPTVTQFIQLDIDSQQGGGNVANIDYEQQKADVTRYYATYWIEDTGSGFNQLQYSQTILLQIPITLPGASEPTNIVFPHITTNTLTRVAEVIAR
ncbi:MAG TPA: heme-binding protein [Allosphingosinicella sp.]|nr:heme-binding protein [Allosphingosinicella sp.]